MNIHDDLPHPVPAYAHLRYKENYFFVLMAPDQDCFGVIHLNHEPGHDRARYTCNLSIRGKQIAYANTTAFPTKWDFERRIGDGTLMCHFAEPHARFELSLHNDDVKADLVFTRLQETFDFSACRTVGNPAPTFLEINTLGMNLPYNHHQQALKSSGTIQLPGEEPIVIDGVGYRDHSWVMRGDSTITNHLWCGINFPSISFGAKLNATVSRPDDPAKEAYAADADGTRAIKLFEVERVGPFSEDGLPEYVVHRLTDVFDRTYTIKSHVGGRYARVPLVAEASGFRPAYNIVENFCPTELLETGEKGIALVEIGRNATIGGPYL